MTHRNQNQTGFALLITILVIGVVLAIGLSILELTQKQVRLANNSADSEAAFHATNAGLECARYWRRARSADFEQAGDVTGTECFDFAEDFEEVGLGVMSNTTTFGAAYRYTADFSWDSGDRCSEIDILVMVNPPTAGGTMVLDNVDQQYPGYPDSDGTTKLCEPGGRCTLISVRGYNKACSQINTIGTVQREVLLQF